MENVSKVVGVFLQTSRDKELSCLLTQKCSPWANQELCTEALQLNQESSGGNRLLGFPCKTKREQNINISVFSKC